jgi:ABC-type polysaccharide/polyol phosphate export permease
MLAYRAIFMQGQEPVWQSLLYPAAVSLILIGAGFLAFARLQHEILDEV